SLAPTEPDACHVVEDFKLLTAICGLADCDLRKNGLSTENPLILERTLIKVLDLLKFQRCPLLQ
ncbi:MAG: hypothetical protein ACXVCA_19240, partial [Bdellovibrio sp.]